MSKIMNEEKIRRKKKQKYKKHTSDLFWIKKINKH